MRAWQIGWAVVSLGFVVGLAGCRWVPVPATGQKYDPFLMSHLTHGANDTQFADATDESDEFAAQPASISRKADYSRRDRPGAGNLGQPARAEDYSWLRGRVSRRSGQDGGWALRYAEPAVEPDAYGGEILLDETARLGMLREGDWLYVEGRPVQRGPGDVRYHVGSFALIEP